MTLLAVGLNHKSAPVELREKLAFSEAELPSALDALLQSDDISEAVIVSTCNRTEVYAVGVTAPKGLAAVMQFLQAHKQLSDGDLQDFANCSYFKQAEAMVENLFMVVSSLDSLVLGEAQILGQVRRAYMTASDCGATGEQLNHLFRQALELGKAIRAKTQIGAHPVSVSTVAVSLATQILGSLEGKNVLVLGAGEMAELTLTYLAEKGVEGVGVVNRTLSKAQDLAGRFNGKSYGLDDLGLALADADILIASARSQEYIVTPKALQTAMRKHTGPLLIIDIALPRNVDPACSQISGVHLYDLDGLGSIIDEHRHEREQEAAKAEGIVHKEVDAYLLWLQEREVKPTIKELYRKAARICEKEAHEAVGLLSKARGGEPVSDAEEQVLKQLANAVSKKILHGPVMRMRKQAANPDAYAYTTAMRFLFGLDSNPNGLPCGHNREHCAMDKGRDCQFSQAGSCPFGREGQ